MKNLHVRISLRGWVVEIHRDENGWDLQLEEDASA